MLKVLISVKIRTREYAVGFMSDAKFVNIIWIMERSFDMPISSSHDGLFFGSKSRLLSAYALNVLAINPKASVTANVSRQND